ncbi:CHAT domain-containing protein [Calothrix sp. FACHB-156]|nr:CHAT domain-containing protein [Calothrix sp. FACHB-156]
MTSLLNWRRWLTYCILFIVSLVLCLSWGTYLLNQQKYSVVAQSVPSGIGIKQSVSNVQQGMIAYQAGKFLEAIALWQKSLPQIREAKERAAIYNNLGLAYRQIGKLAEAIGQWEQAIQIYRSQNDPSIRQLLPKLLTEQGQAYTDLGQPGRAIPLLESAVELVHQNQDKFTEAAVQGALGNAYWASSDYQQALIAQEKSKEIALKLHNASYIATALNNLGNIYVSRAERYRYQAQSADAEGDDQEVAKLKQAEAFDLAAARKSFEQSVAAVQGLSWSEEFRSLMNFNHFLRLKNITSISTSDQNLIMSNWQRAKALLISAPNSREKAYGLIKLAVEPGLVNSRQQLVEILEQALVISRSNNDVTAESFALGSLGKLYQEAGEYSQAMTLTWQAQFAAQQADAAHSLYRWQRQAGQIFQKTGAIKEAIAAYQQAIITLQTIRGDLVTASKELQFDFREQVEPIYRELINLLLMSEPSNDLKIKSSLTKTSNSQLNQVVDTLELLKLAELQNFFGDECVQVALSKVSSVADSTHTQATVIYSIVLDDHTEMILQSPSGEMTHYRVEINQKDFEAEIDQLRYLLELQATEEYIPQAQKIYNLLIRPLDADIARIKPHTLVFINDGVLRKIPMAALHDGQKFLVEKYTIANTPSLSLTTYQTSNRGKLSALILGLTKGRQDFPPLTNVEAEATTVKKIVGGTELLDENFTFTNLQKQLRRNSYPIIHMATHGKFGVDAKSTFLLEFDRKINVEEIDQLLRSTSRKQLVELLTLSACQTAAGDNRSALGIAGVAVRAGVNSALATLWYINDEATLPLIEEFYQQLLQPGITKAEALRKAQMKMIADLNSRHPAIWSPFILIGNWL